MNRPASTLVALAALIGCAHAASPPPAKGQPMKPTPTADVPFVFGPSTADPAALLHWLEQQHDAVRLPVWVTFGAAHATVTGGVVVSSAKDAPAFALDDTALGISLADRARTALGDVPRGALWLEGRWQPGRLTVTRAGAKLANPADEAQLFAAVEVPGAKPELVALTTKLGGDTPLAEKREAGRQLVAAGMEAIPILIASLGDGRPYERRDAANRMNLPNGAVVEPLWVTTTAGTRCEDLLHELITPVASAGVGGNFKVFSQQVLRISDWRAFWAAKKTKSLAQLHDELRPLVDAYWKAHGTTQTVP